MRQLLFRLLTVGLLMAVFVPSAFAQSENPLAGTYWQAADSGVTLGFASDDLVTGSGGCNTFSGTYTLDGDTISFSEIVSTLMLCEGTGDQETAFFNALESATRYEVTDYQLTIWHSDDQQLTFIPDPAGALVGTQWQLLSYAETPVIANSMVTLEFRADNQVVGSGGCNDYGGGYLIEDDGVISFTDLISTLMACGDDTITLQEQEYLNALQTATGFELADNQLTITYGDGEQLNFILIDKDVLAGTQWQLASYGNADAETPLVPESVVTLEFVDDSQVNGSGGCNSFSSTYQVSGDTISFTPVISTRMACTNEAIGTLESTFFNALGTATRYEVTDENLLIWYDNDQWHLTFTPMPETA